MRCIDRHNLRASDTSNGNSGTSGPRKVFRKRCRPLTAAGLLALPGVVAVVGALVTAAISFAILVGVTPITPDETTTHCADRHQHAFRRGADRAHRPRGSSHRHGEAARKGRVAAACAHRRHVLADRRAAGDPCRRHRVDHARHRPRSLVRDPHQDDHQLVPFDRRSLCAGKRAQPAGHDAVDGQRPRQCAHPLRPRPHRISRISRASRPSAGRWPMRRSSASTGPSS